MSFSPSIPQVCHSLICALPGSKSLAVPRCVADDDDKFCYCANCVPPETPAYFDESSDDEEEISPLYHERLRVQEEFLAEQFDDDRPPMSPMSDGSPEHPYRVFSPYEERRRLTIVTTSPEV